MEVPFDPYLQWLAIRDPKRPPNHYRLLGIDLFESDVEVIQNAADRQMTHIRRFQGGIHSAESQQLLNELSGAKICLLHAEKKAAYDAALRTEGRPIPRVTTPPPLVPGRDFSASPPPIGLSLTTSPAQDSALSNFPPAAASTRSSVEDVSIPSMPLPLTKLQKRQTGNPAARADFEIKSDDSRPPKTNNGIFSLSLFLCMIGAALAILVGLLVLWSNTKIGR
jgi:hypothetical protein